jgi:tetratricopeptide (TPR) repeat protein
MLVAVDHSEEALTLLESKLVYFDQSAAIRTALGHIYLLRHEDAKAVGLFQQAAMLRPDDLTVVEDLARAQLAAKQFDGAIASLRRLCQDPSGAKRSDLQCLLGAAYTAGGRLNEARDAYTQAMQMAPQDPDVWQKLGETCLALSDADGAIAAAHSVMNLAPQRHEAFILAGLGYRSLGKTPAALACFEKAADLAPVTAAPLILLGITLEQAGRTGEAVKAYTRALERAPQDARVRQLLARLTPGA